MLDDPLKLLDPNLVVYPKITDPSSLFAVGKGQTVTNTVTDVPDGTYAVLGACSDLLDLETLGKPRSWRAEPRCHRWTVQRHQYRKPERPVR